MGIYSINNILENRIKKIKIKDTPLPYKDDRIDDHIEDYEDDSGNEVIEDGETQDELEDEYEKFMSMTYAQRKASNDKSIELFGIDNIEHYNRLKSKLIKNNKYEISEGVNVIPPSDKDIQSLESDKNHEIIKYEKDKITIAKDWSNSSMITIMTPDIYDIDMLEKRWSKWKNMIYKHRKDSNSKCVELFGMDNQQMYEKLRSKFLRKNQAEPLDNNDEYINMSTSEDIITSESVILQEGLFKDKRNIDIALAVLNMNDKKIFKELKQKNYTIVRASDERNIAIIYKYFEENMPQDYMLHTINRTSDTSEKFVLISLYHKNTPVYHIFPIIKKSYKDVIDLYCIYDINGEYTYSIIDTIEVVDSVKENCIYNLLENQKKKEIKKEIKKEQLSILNYADNLPYFTPDEMIDMGVYNYNGNFYSPISDNIFINEEKNIKCQKWFENYNLLYHGIINEDTDRFCRYRINKLTELYKDYDKLLESGNQNKINKRKQSILELGWNPEIKFTVQNRILANQFLRESYNKMPIKINDISNYNDEDIIQETKIDRDKYAVYVVLTYTGTVFGKLINKWTQGIYSHAALGLESDLKELYSFNASVNGFSKESIESYAKENKNSLLCTYVVYLNKFQYDKLKEKLNYFDSHRTRYSFINIVGLILNKPIELAHDMICSQFVDSILKYAGVDINNKQSSLVTPNDFYMSNSNKLIKLYEGKTVEYDNKKVNRLINLYNKKAVNEAKEFPIQFDKDGNLLIKNMKKLNYEAEYAKAHKLLVIYDQNNNIEGMKYELSKLWFMNNLLEKKIYDKKTTEQDKKDAQKARAKILNDFNLYLKKVQKIDDGFNFTEYYEETPFSDAMIKIDKNTVHHSARLLKAILR